MNWKIECQCVKLQHQLIFWIPFQKNNMVTLTRLYLREVNSNHLNIILDCMIPDTENWHVKTGVTNLADCNQACKNENWQWMVLSKQMCYCFEAVTIGFWHETDCSSKTADEEKVTAYKLWKISCPSLKSMPMKALILKDHNPSFLIGSNATFDCILGHETESGDTGFEINCLPDGDWSMSPNELPSCLPKSCSNLDQDIVNKAEWNLNHHIKVLRDSQVEQSTFSLNCPDEQYFYEKYQGSTLEIRVGEIHAICNDQG